MILPPQLRFLVLVHHKTPCFQQNNLSYSHKDRKRI